MILLLLLLAASRGLAQAPFQFKPCPDESACLYHARCLTHIQKPEVTFSTAYADQTAYKKFEGQTKCNVNTNDVSKIGLYLRPISNHKWNITLEFTHDDEGVQFGDLLSIMFNGTEATFNQDPPIEIPLERDHNETDITLSDGMKFEFQTLRLTVESNQEKLFDIFNEMEIVFIDGTQEGGATSSKQPVFWQRVNERTSCDASLIIDDCSPKTKNCTALNVVERDIKCIDSTMWLKSDNSTWQKLIQLFCDPVKKEWAVYNTIASGSLAMPSKGIEIRCAVEEPEPWAASLTGRTPSGIVLDGEKKKESGDGFALIDSPFTWVAIGLAGLIALAAVALAIGYAYRKLGKKPPADKSAISKVSFQRLPQESQTGATSDSNSEAERGKADQPLLATPTPTKTKTPATDAAEVTRADAPTADTVNRLSMIKTIQDTSNIAPIPTPPPSN